MAHQNNISGNNRSHTTLRPGEVKNIPPMLVEMIDIVQYSYIITRLLHPFERPSQHGYPDHKRDHRGNRTQ